MVTKSPCTPAPPVSWKECRERGWRNLDILLVTGDAYVDHPSFGIALIARLLESKGYRVAILPQPETRTAADFKSYPAPKLFCGISSGNLDSIVANYTGNGKVRDHDAYSPNGNPWRGNEKEKKSRRRPDRATLVYTSLAKSAYPNTPVILGGVEASLRRFVHYDYKQAKLRASFLTDAKADLLVYGMGERAIIEAARRCKHSQSLAGINGTCLRLTDQELEAVIGTSTPKNSRDVLVLPSLSEINENKLEFLRAEQALDAHSKAYSSRIVLQRQQSHWVLQHPAQKPLTTEELDALHALDFTRKPNPPELEIPAHKMIEHSVTIVRGCSGNCSFCAITRHQGPAITSRSEKSILKECTQIANAPDFKGTISDLGGPTANLFATSCAIGSCKKRDCLYPKPCPNLQIDEHAFINLLKKVRNLKNVKNVFISSGLRMELLLKSPALMKQIILHHTPGTIKVAPEHTDNAILKLMHKEPHDLLQRFVTACREISTQTGRKKVRLTPYIITSHPGSTPENAKNLARDLRRLNLDAKKFQDFTPTPGTLSTAMYVTETDPETKKRIHVPKNHSERMRERKILESVFHKRQQPSKKGSGNQGQHHAKSHSVRKKRTQESRESRQIRGRKR
ncbi:MAG: YgiQ family radical SAM protein [Desulfobacterales bacterium]|nr:MAG: YgiQ family radical SAM protein [Desulfobacterales bacterium]